MATALAVPQLPPAEISDDAWREARWLPCQLRAEAHVEAFTMGDLMRVEVGSIVDSGIPLETDVAVTVNGACVGYGKLDLVGEKLAIRLTELV
jgi:flagellar motor switch/type III secretory pathway protein FliN